MNYCKSSVYALSSHLALYVFPKVVEKHELVGLEPVLVNALHPLIDEHLFELPVVRVLRQLNTL